MKRGYIRLWNKIWASKINGDISSLNDKGETTEKVILRYSLNAISNSPLFNSNDAYEVSIKGFLQYLGETEFINKCYIAITDVPLEFVEIFREVAGIFSIRKFPENVQLCITDKNTKQLLIMLGDNYLQAISNALILSYGNGFESFSEKEYLQSKDLFLSMTGLKDDISIVIRDYIIAITALSSKSFLSPQSIYEKLYTDFGVYRHLFHTVFQHLLPLFLVSFRPKL